MRYFLVVYNRITGAVDVKDFAASQREQALAERFARELKERHQPEIEVVVLGAESRAALERTHARYFHSVKELAHYVEELAASGL
jgi:hypothetical protein